MNKHALEGPHADGASSAETRSTWLAVVDQTSQGERFPPAVATQGLDQQPALVRRPGGALGRIAISSFPPSRRPVAEKSATELAAQDLSDYQAAALFVRHCCSRYRWWSGVLVTLATPRRLKFCSELPSRTASATGARSPLPASSEGSQPTDPPSLRPRARLGGNVARREIGRVKIRDMNAPLRGAPVVARGTPCDDARNNRIWRGSSAASDFERGALAADLARGQRSPRLRNSSRRRTRRFRIAEGRRRHLASCADRRQLRCESFPDFPALWRTGFRCPLEHAGSLRADGSAAFGQAGPGCATAGIRLRCWGGLQFRTRFGPNACGEIGCGRGRRR